VIPGFRILGNPAMYLFAFTGEGKNMGAIAACSRDDPWP